jgi:hypothetical protein
MKVGEKKAEFFYILDYLLELIIKNLAIATSDELARLICHNFV